MFARSRLNGLVSVLGLVLLLSMPAVAQEPEAKKPEKTGTVSGQLLFYDGKPLADATIILKAEKGEFETQTKTDKEGNYRVENVPVGAYSFVVRIGDQEVFELRKVPLREREDNIQDINLKAEARKQGQKLSDEQIAEMRKSIENQRKGKSLKFQFAQGVWYLKNQQYAKAVTEFEAARDIDPTQVAVHANLARAYGGTGQIQEGIASYLKAIELKPDEGGFHNNLGQLYLKAGRIDDGISAFEKAAEINPKKAGMFYFNIGVTLYNASRLKDAIEPFKKTVEVEPKRAEAHYFLGVCLFQNADWVNMKPLPGTVEAFETYLKLEPKGRFANEAKQTIESIKTTFKLK